MDLAYVMEDLKQLEDGFVQKAYQRDDELTLEIYVPGDEKKRLIIGTSYCFLSSYKRDNPERPPGFVMELRKHLGKVDRIQQRGFDRILEIESGDHKLVCELFGKGNFCLLKGEKVIGALRQEEFADRKVVVGEDYEPPEPAIDPRESEDIFAEVSGELVKSLARDLSLGGTYAEEIVTRAGVDKSLEVQDMGEQQRKAVREAFREVTVSEPQPVLYREDDRPSKAAPFPLETYSNLESESFDSFSGACDELFYRRVEQQREEKQRARYEEKREGLEQQLKQQRRKVEGLEKASQQNQEKAEAVYENYQLLEEIKKAVETGLQEHTWKETEKRFRESEKELSDRVNAMNEQEGFVSVDLGDLSVKIEPEKDLEATASEYYDRAKAREEKMENAREAMEETERELEQIEEKEFKAEESSMKDRSEKRSKRWFEKYRWFRTSEDHLVCLGRDAQTNEMLVEKHMEKQDLYFHADFDGAPSVVLKQGKEAPEEDRKEAARAAVTFAKTWKAGIGADTVYFVEPKQVTKNPESGEYLPKGSFVIRGDREYMHNVKVDASLGAYELDGTYVPMCGPESAVEQHCENLVMLKPGRRKKSEIGKEINRRMAEQGCEMDLDYIIRALPPGKSELK